MAAGVQRLFLIIGTAMHPRLSITPLGLICAAGLAAAVAGGGVLLAADRPSPQPNPAAAMPAPPKARSCRTGWFTQAGDAARILSPTLISAL